MDSLQSEIHILKEEIEKIKIRNVRVESDKAWETSKTRTTFIAISTYILIYIVMRLMGDNHSVLNAFLASVSYLLSSTTYSLLKSWWLQKRKH